MGNLPEDEAVPDVVPDPGKKCKLSVFPLSHFGAAIEEDLFMTRYVKPNLI
jgi:hypothetical protein